MKSLSIRIQRMITELEAIKCEIEGGEYSKETSIFDLDFSTRVMSCFSKCEVKNVSDIYFYSKINWINMGMFGIKSFNDMNNVLHQNGFKTIEK